MAELTTAHTIPGSVKGRDTAFALGVACILAILFLPVPVPLIDLGLATSIALSVLVLMVALWIDRPLHFSAFPTVLLIATMLRLSLNVATTRTILAHGHEGTDAAGGVIGGFSRFVMGGDFLIGVVVFLILVTVNFVVITKGAGRIAEVSARFTLDGIPGKQMAIDADLSAGNIDEHEARSRRAELEEESAFFGSMDGASKFVRGDAVAGLLITAVNMIGGIAIGMSRHGMSAGEAADVFVKLSVGDGLVSQIPALIVSLASGLVVSKGGTRGSADQAVIGQVVAQPRALMVAAALLLVMALVPGLPFLPFALLGGVLAVAGLVIPRRRVAREARAAAQEAERREKAEEAVLDAVETALAIPEMELVMGSATAALLAVERDELLHRMARLRHRFAARYGVLIPDIALRTDPNAPENGYAIHVHGTVAARGEVHPRELLVVPREGLDPVIGETAREPAFGLPAVRVPRDRAEEVRRKGHRPIEPLSIVLTHIAETVRSSLARLLTRRELRKLVERLDPLYAKIADEIGNGAVGWSGLLAVLRMLLAERVSIRSLDRILEAIAELPAETRREAMAEHVRQALGHAICADVAADGPLRLLRLGTAWEAMLTGAIRRDARGDVAAFDIGPKTLRDFGEAMKDALPASRGDPLPAVATTPELRPFVRMIAERIDPDIAVLAHVEMPHRQEIEVVGVLRDPSGPVE